MTAQTSQKSFTWMQFSVRFVVMFLVLAVPLFAISGRLDWWEAWVYLLIVVGMTFYGRAMLMILNRELIDERVSSLSRDNTKNWDRLLSPLVGVILPVVMLTVAALDMRFGWTSVVIPLWAKIIAAVLIALGTQIANRAMIVNRFFSGTVRIQEDRNHQVISDGPYRFVRHPGYAAGVLADSVTPILLGTLWALIPALILCAVLVLRTALEDRTLQAELPGYADYAQRVRYRLLPLIW